MPAVLIQSAYLQKQMWFLHSFTENKPMKKKNRVRKNREFQKLIHTGTKAAGRSFVFYYAPKAEEEARIGITLSGKIGDAVHRNRIKRQTRMMCEELIDFSSCPFDGILIVRFNFRDLTYEQNKKNLEKLLAKAKMDKRIFPSSTVT